MDRKPSYRLTSEAGPFPLAPGENLIGSFRHCDVVLDEEGVAGEHARIDVWGGKVFLYDLGAPPGTFMEGVRVSGVVELAPGQTIRAGSASLRLEVADSPASPGRRTALKALRLLVYAGLGLVGLLVLATLSFPIIYNSERIKRKLARGVEKVLKRNVRIGSLEANFFRTELLLRDFVVENLPEFGSEPLLSASSVEVRLGAGGYGSRLGEELDMEILVRSPVLSLKRDYKGRWNLGDVARAFTNFVRTPEGFSWRPPFSRLRLTLSAEDVTLRFQDELTGWAAEYTGGGLKASLPALDAPLTYEATLDMSLAGKRGRTRASGSFRLFTKKGGGGEATPESIWGELVKLEARDLDLRAVPFLPGVLRAPAAGELELLVRAFTLRATKAHLAGRLRDARPGLGEIAFTAEASSDITRPSLDSAELTVRSGLGGLTCRTRVIPEEDAQQGAQVLDLDASVDVELEALARLLGLGDLRGRAHLDISTTGPTSGLGVKTELRVRGLDCPLTPAGPEDLEAALRAEVRLDGWTRLEGVHLKSAGISGSFLSAELSGLSLSLPRAGASPKGRATGGGSLTIPTIRAGTAPAGLEGLMKVELDLHQLSERYGPVLGLRPLAEKLRVRAVFDPGEEGATEVRYTAELSHGRTWAGAPEAVRMEGKGKLCARGPEPGFDFTSKLGAGGGLDGELSGRLNLGGGRGFDLVLSASGELSRLWGYARPYLSDAGAVWAQGAFRLENCRISGRDGRLAADGRLELLNLELWGGDVKVRPFSEGRFDAIWNLSLSTSGRPSLKVSVLKGTSSALSFRLKGEVSDLSALGGRYEIELLLDCGKVGSVLKKLGILSVLADTEGTAAIELKADTNSGTVELSRLHVDTPFIEAEGGGALAGLPLAVFAPPNERREKFEAAAGPSREVSGHIKIDARVWPGRLLELLGEVPELEWLALMMSTREARPPEVGRASDEPLELAFRASGSGKELLFDGSIGLGVLSEGRARGESARLEFSGSAGRDREYVLEVDRGVLTVGTPGNGSRIAFSLRVPAGGTRRSRSFVGERVELDLSSTGLDLPRAAALVPELSGWVTGGKGDLALKVALPLEGEGEARVRGRAALRGLDFTLPWRPLFKVTVDGEISFRGRTAGSRRIELKLARHTPGGRARAGPGVEAGRVERILLEDLSLAAGPAGLEGTFLLRSEDLDLGEAASACEGLKLPETLALLGELDIRRARAGMFVLEGLQGKLRVEGNRITIAPLTFGVSGGRGEGSLSIELGEELGVSGSVRVEKCPPGWPEALKRLAKDKRFTLNFRGVSYEQNGGARPGQGDAPEPRKGSPAAATPKSSE